MNYAYIFKEVNYQNILMSILEQRQEKNHRYSLRAFSRDLGVSSSRLSIILNRKAHFSIKTAQRISRRLDFSPLEEDYFINLFIAETKRDTVERAKAIMRAKAIRLNTSYQVFDSKILNHLDWKHFAVGFVAAAIHPKPVPSAIAERLNLRTDDTRKKLKEMIRAGLLIENPESYETCFDRIRLETNLASKPIQTFHYSLLKKALDSIGNVPYEKRFLRSCIFTLNQTQYLKLQDLIVSFVSACTDHEEDLTDPHTEVYGFTVQLFPLSSHHDMPQHDRISQH